MGGSETVKNMDGQTKHEDDALNVILVMFYGAACTFKTLKGRKSENKTDPGPKSSGNDGLSYAFLGGTN